MSSVCLRCEKHTPKTFREQETPHGLAHDALHLGAAQCTRHRLSTGSRGEATDGHRVPMHDGRRNSDCDAFDYLINLFMYYYLFNLFIGCTAKRALDVQNLIPPETSTQPFELGTEKSNP